MSALTNEKRKYIMDKKYTIAVAGTGLLSQHHMNAA